MTRSMKPDIVIFVAALILYAVLVSVFWGYTVDDAYISFRYAENLAQGNGLVFNPGERVEGYSNLTWTLLLSGAASLGLNVPLFARWAGIVSGAAVLVILGIGFRVSGFGFRVRTVPLLQLSSILLAAMVPFSAWAGAGLETVFHTALITAGMFCLTLETSRRMWWISVIVFGLIAISRPEGLLFAVAAAGAMAFSKQPGGMRHAAGWLVVPALFLAAQMAFRLYYYGDWLPNTFRAKVGSDVTQLMDGLRYVGGFLYGFGWITVNPPPLGPMGIQLMRVLGCLPFVMLLFLIPGMSRRESTNDEPNNNLLPRFLYLSIILNLLFMIAVGGDWMRPYRFFVPILPALALILDRAALQMTGRFFANRRKAAYVAIIILMAFLAVKSVIPARIYTENYERGNRVTAIRFGRELLAESNPGDIIAMGDCGALPYYSKLRVIDLYGLMNRRIAGWEGKATRAQPQPEDLDWIFDAHPRYVALEINTKNRAGLKGVDQAILAHPRFRADYGPEPIKSGFFSPAEQMLIFERKKQVEHGGTNQAGS